MKFRSLPIFLFIASAHFYGQVTPPQTTQSSEAVAQHEGTYVLKDIIVDGVKNTHLSKFYALQVL